MIKKNERRAQDVNLSTDSSHNEEYLEPGTLHALDYEPGTLVSLDGSGEDASEIVGGLIYMIIAACIFYFYAMDEFNIIGAIFYSLYWIITVPVHLIFF